MLKLLEIAGSISPHNNIWQIHDWLPVVASSHFRKVSDYYGKREVQMHSLSRSQIPSQFFPVQTDVS